MNKMLPFMSLILISLTIFAENSTDPVRIKCSSSSINLRSVEIGFKCVTAKGAVFERVSKESFGEAWRGPDGLIWSDRIANILPENASYSCWNLGGNVPDRLAFVRGESYGFREVLPNMKGHGFWYKFFGPYKSYHFFVGNTGEFDGDTRSNDGSLRCVLPET